MRSSPAADRHMLHAPRFGTAPGILIKRPKTRKQRFRSFHRAEALPSDSRLVVSEWSSATSGSRLGNRP